MYERSRFAADLGAAVILAPNAAGILKRLGVDPEKDGAVPRQWVSNNAPNHTPLHVFSRAFGQKRSGEEPAFPSSSNMFNSARSILFLLRSVMYDFMTGTELSQRITRKRSSTLLRQTKPHVFTLSVGLHV